MTTYKKPFGLSIACNIAAKAIKDNLAPTSIILANLLLLQKSKLFPKELEPSFFLVAKQQTTVEEKKLISNILNDLRGPHQTVSEVLKKHVETGWVKKISEPRSEQKLSSSKSGFNSKTKPQKNAFKTSTKKEKRKVVKTEHSSAKVPVVTIKKSKLI